MRSLIEFNDSRVDMKSPIHSTSKKGESKEDLIRMVRKALEALGIDKNEL